ncbi:MAG: hypothetical protein Kow0058_05960 [Roseovarius sp.]
MAQMAQSAAEAAEAAEAAGEGIAEPDHLRMAESAREATEFLKAIGHEGRLMILCHLVNGEKSVGELERLLAARQAAVSQQLSRLRAEGLVVPRREGKTIFYRLADDRPRQVLELLYALFCDGADAREQERRPGERSPGAG